MKTLRMLLILTAILAFSANLTFGDEYRAGLAGAQYDNDEFTEIDEDGNIMYGLEQHWASALGNDWRAAWHGFIEGPFTGDVTISAEFEDGMELVLDGKVVIDGIKCRLRNKRSCVVKMTKGQKMPVTIKFITFNSKAFLKLQWQWEGSPKVVIPGEALSYKLSELPLDLRFELEYVGLENALNWAIYDPAKPALPANQIDVTKAKICVLSNNKVLNNGADMLTDEILKRTMLDIPIVKKMDASGVCFVIGTADDIAANGIAIPKSLTIPQKKDSYAVWVDQGKKLTNIYMIGHDKRGALYAVGRLLRMLDMGRQWAYLDKDVKIATSPKYALRGHQLGYRAKTNSYDAWTLKMWEQYYRDMIVFGMNAVELIPPRSDDDDDSPHLPKPQLEMMIAMSQLAADYGLDVWAWWPAIDGDYRNEETVRDSIAQWGDVFRKLPKLDVVFVPGGDPGGTHPAVLLPLLEKQKKNLNRYHPNAQMWVSPQMFNYNSDGTGWLADFLDILNKDEPAWLDGVVFGPQIRITLPELRSRVPARYPIRRYPDITHCTRCQYKDPNWDIAYRRTLGREPINPRPTAYTKIFRDLQQYAMGFITYSEGCNDDFNKILWSCLGWDPNMDTNEIAKQYSRYFISQKFQDKFAQGLFGLERNWVGPLKDNDGVYKTLELFQDMEKNATPQDKLNWRFQQGLYRAYYDAYVKARLEYETNLQAQAIDVLKNAKNIGAIKALDEAQAILDKAGTQKTKTEWRARTFELAEALYQSIRMQLSVEKYQAIRTNRGANLDEIDKPLNDRDKLKTEFDGVRKMASEDQRLEAIKKMTD